MRFARPRRRAELEIVEIAPELDCAQEVRERVGRGDEAVHRRAAATARCITSLQALVHSEAALAVLPLGTYNHFARDLGIPLDWREALEVALDGRLAPDRRGPRQRALLRQQRLDRSLSRSSWRGARRAAATTRAGRRGWPRSTRRCGSTRT